MYMATWSDIERAMDGLEDLDKATLEAFSRVMSEASENPAYLRRFDQAQQRIRRRLEQIEAEEMHSSQKRSSDRSNDHWYKKPVGIVILGVSVGLLVLVVKFLLGL
jgi:ferric-dicitrate binding protein FerR (iron transport regulator)